MKLNFLKQLDEANVYNVQQPLNNISVQSYLTKLLGRIPDDVKAPMIKKLTKLIINDNTILQPISQLPPDAPEWAQAAAAVGDLYAFVPNEQINDRMTHIAHYIQTLTQDSKGAKDENGQADQDKTAVATKELQGLPKVENLGVMYNKALEYFARGTKKVARVADGMERISETKGFTWYKLVDAEAYRREGKTLQNCIGSIYTKERCDREGTTIVIMRDNKTQNTVVAMRIRDNKVQEFKGKQNLPPIPRYMPAVVEFIEKNNLTFASTSDLFNAGYVLDEKTNKIRSIDQVLSEQSKREQIGTTDKGYNIFAMKMHDLTDPKIRQLVVNSRLDRLSYYSSVDVQASDVLYELGTQRGVASACLVRHKVVQNVKDLTDENWKDRGFTEPILELINYLGAQGLAESLASSVTANQPMLNTMTFNEKTRKFEEATAAETREVEINGQKFGVRSYDGATARGLGNNIINALKDYTYNNREYTTPDVTAERVMVIPDNANITAIIQTTDGMLLPMTGSAKRVENKLMPRDGSARDIAQRTLIADYANQNDLVIPLSVCRNRGIIKGPEGYKPFVPPKPITVTGNISKFDLSGMSEPEAFLCASMASTAQLDRNWTYDKAINHYYGKPDTPYVNLTTNVQITGEDSTKAQIAPFIPTDQNVVAGWKKVKETRYRGGIPAALYFASSKSLSRFVMAVDANKNVLSVDTLDNFRGHKGGAIRAAANKFVNEINDVVQKEGLKLSRSSTAGMSLSFGVDRANNKLVTQTQKTAAGMDKASKDEFKMTLSDGTVIRRMTTDEFNEWQEGVRSVRNSAHFYVVEQGGADDQPAKQIAVIATDKTDTHINRVYSTTHADAESGPKHDYFNPRVAKYVATFAKEKGITKFPTNASFRDHGDTVIRWLKAVQAVENALPRHKGIYYISNKAGSYGGARADMTLAQFNDNSNSEWTPRVLADNGLIRPVMEPTRNRLTLELTAKGRKAIADAGTDELSSEYQLFNTLPSETTRKEEPAPEVQPAAEPANGEEPAPAAPRERAPRAPREGGESKAGRAMARFREIAQANGGTIPSRADFIAVLRQEPFNMTPAGASTYYHNIKVKYAQEQGQLGETFTFSEYLRVFAE